MLIRKKNMIQEAKALEDAGAAMLQLECVPDNLTADIMKSISIPVIRELVLAKKQMVQIMVIHDLLGGILFRKNT